MLDSYRFDSNYHPSRADHSMFRLLEEGIFSHGDFCPVLTKEMDRLRIHYFNWGNEGTHYIYSRKSVLPVHHSSLSKQTLLPSSRVLIPANAFYFHTPDGRKWKAELAHAETFCFAAVRYQRLDIHNQHSDHFSILATSSISEMRDFHGLMPVIVPQKYEMAWLNSTTPLERIQEIATSLPNPPLKITQVEYLFETDLHRSNRAA